MVLAFELVDLDFSSPRCINIVEQSRRSLDRLCLAAWQVVRMVDAGATNPGEVDVERRRLAVRVALSAATHELGAFLLFATSEASTPAGWPGKRAHVAIDILALVDETIDALEGETFRLLPQEVDGAFMEMGLKVYGSRDPNEWHMPVAAPHDDRVIR